MYIYMCVCMQEWINGWIGGTHCTRHSVIPSIVSYTRPSSHSPSHLSIHSSIYLPLTCAGMYAVCRPSHWLGSTPSASAISGRASDSSRTRIRYSSAVVEGVLVSASVDQSIDAVGPSIERWGGGRCDGPSPYPEPYISYIYHAPEAGGSPLAARARTFSTSRPDSVRSTGRAGSSIIYGWSLCCGGWLNDCDDGWIYLSKEEASDGRLATEIERPPATDATTGPHQCPTCDN